MKAPIALGTMAVTMAVAVALLNASPAHAQAAPAQEPTGGGLQEVVVTARYREENLQQTPIAITAITAEAIQTRGFTAASDIGYTVPNASFRPAQQAFGNTMTAYIRGVGQNDFNFAFEPGVGIYVDDVYYPTTMASQFDLLDIQRVEVLRGPQGTLFGRGSIGGAVRYVTRQPVGDNTGYIEATGGEFSRVDVRAGYDFSMIPDTLFARITGVSRQQNGYQRVIDFVCANPTLAGSLPATTFNRGSGCQTGTLGGTAIAGGRVQLRFVASEAFEIGLAFDIQRDNSEARADWMVGIVPPGTSCAPFLTAGQPCPGAVRWNEAMIARYGVPYDLRFLTEDKFISYATFNDPYSGLSFPPRTALEQRGVAATFDWKFADNADAKLITAYRKWNGSFSTDQDGSPLGYSVVDGLQNFIYKTVELRFSGRSWDRLDWTVGAFYYHGNGQNAQQVALPPFMAGPRCQFSDALTGYLQDPTGVCVQPNGSVLPNSLLVNGLDNGRFENISGFVHGVYSLTDTLRLTLGGRYSDDKKHDDFDNTIFQTPVDSNGTRFDWRVGLDYQVSTAVLGYGSVSTGYRPPAYNPRPFQPSQFVAVAGENMTAYELGFKSDLFNRTVRLNLAGFYSDYKQRIVPVGGVECIKTPQGVPVPGNVPDPQGGPPCLGLLPLTSYVNSPGKIKGGELEFDYRPTEGLLIQGQTGYTHFTANNELTGGITANGQPVYVPEWNGSASLQYAFNLKNGASITPRYDAYLQTQICSAVTTTTSCSGGYTLHNIRLEYATSERKWTTAVGVTNFTDHEYLLNIFDLTPFGEATIEGQPGPPRQWFVSFRRNFQ